MKPLLAANAPKDLSWLRYPLLASPKLDGIRAIKEGGRLITRKGLAIPNIYIQSVCSGLPDGLDGELVLADWTAPYRHVSSAVMSRHGEPDFRFVAFDIASPAMEFAPYSLRNDELAAIRSKGYVEQLMVMPQEKVSSVEELEAIVALHESSMYEGTMVRNPFAGYKRGRSTLTEGIMLKIKRWEDEEATVLAIHEEQENLNDKDERGRRHGFSEGKFGKGRLGAIECRFEDGTEFRCGTGFDARERSSYWASPLYLPGKSVTIKHLPPPGGRQPGEAPRFPVFKGIRHD